MIEYVKQIITGQFEAALCMLERCVRVCPPEHWEGRIANGTFRWVAYHSLFFVDLYLSTGDENEFVLREFHQRGGDERGDEPCPGLSREETLEYVAICRQKMLDAIAAETAESLQTRCHISWRTITRGELHIYNLRHVQHHTGQLSAFLRRVDPTVTDRRALPWVETGWRSS